MPSQREVSFHWIRSLGEMMAGRSYRGPGSELERVRGIGTRYARMLKAAGVTSVRELATQDALDLSDALLEVNLLQGMVLVVPSEKRVAGWIGQARTQDP